MFLGTWNEYTMVILFWCLVVTFIFNVGELLQRISDLNYKLHPAELKAWSSLKREKIYLYDRKEGRTRRMTKILETS